MDYTTFSTARLRVPQYLHKQQVPFEEVVHTPAFKAENRVTILPGPARSIAKCVLLATQDAFHLAVLPATHHINLKALHPVVKQPVRLATRSEIGCIFNDCEWGVMGPFGRLYGLKTLLDDTFGGDEAITFEAHLHALSIRMLCRDFERLESPQRFSFAYRIM